MEKARATEPAASSDTLKNHQKPIKFLDGILNGKQVRLPRQKAIGWVKKLWIAEGRPWQGKTG
jgi:hypothetical protein